MTGIVVQFPGPPKKQRNWAWWASLALLGALVLGLALLAGCASTGIGKCGDGCTPDPEVDGAVKACFDSPELGRVCGFSPPGDECVDFFLRSECNGEWEYRGASCQMRGEDHGT